MRFQFVVYVGPHAFTIQLISADGANKHRLSLCEQIFVGSAAEATTLLANVVERFTEATLHWLEIVDVRFALSTLFALHLFLVVDGTETSGNKEIKYTALLLVHKARYLSSLEKKQSTATKSIFDK